MNEKLFWLLVKVGIVKYDPLTAPPVGKDGRPILISKPNQRFAQNEDFGLAVANPPQLRETAGK